MIEKEKFRSYTLDEEKENPLEIGKVFTVRLNSTEYKQLKEDMVDFNLRNESTTLKLLADIGRNVLHGMLTRKKLRWLFSSRQSKLEDL